MKKILLSFIVLFLFSCTPKEVAKKEIEFIVYKNPNCGCCTKWVDHMRDNGFKLSLKEVEDLDELKDKLGVPDDLRSCHTAVYGDYVFEGHIPASSIKKFLAKKSDARGLAVADMPTGSPGMEMGNHKEEYDVHTFRKNGKTEIFESFK